jgi:neutral ceramidase
MHLWYCYELYLRAMSFLKSVLFFVLKTLGIILLLVILFVAASVVPVDRTLPEEQPFYKVMAERLDSLQNYPIARATKGFSIGFAKVNLTPSMKTATAGYGNRKGKLFTTVHDSLYVRAIVIDNGVQRVAIVSADLLIIPPTVTALLATELPAIGFSLNNTYLGAIHTHNSIGNWGEGATRFIYGAYNDSIVHFITSRITTAIAHASKNMLPSKIKAGEIPVGSAVRNRLDGENGKVDSLLRVVEAHRSDSSKLLLMSYTAHATCLYSKDLELSRDYPGKLVDEVESNGYAFSMFLAGAVASHGTGAPEYGWSCIDWMADQITTKFLTDKSLLRDVNDSSLVMVRIPLALGNPQVKVFKDWRIRPWLFRTAFGEYPAHLTALRFGDLVMLGTPCDFSGELTHALDSVAAQAKLHTMVTSFNGGYIGYITVDQYYDRNHYETRLMNWYGRGNGSYLSFCLRKLIEAVSDN